VEFAAGLPPAPKARSGGKQMFKRALRGVVPDAILSRPKKGFSVPLRFWFRDGLADYLGDHLLGPGALAHGWLDRGAIGRLFETYRATGRSDSLAHLWSLLVFELWHRGVREAAAR